MTNPHRTTSEDTMYNDDALSAALDSVADDIDSPDFDQLLSAAIDDASDDILGEF